MLPGATAHAVTVSESAPPAISTSGLTKDFGLGRGVFDLDLRVAQGEVFGFIGPNGAGKTTTIRLLMDLLRADRGSARVFGLDTRAQSLAVKRLVGYLPGELPQLGGLRGREILGLLAAMRGVDCRGRARELAERFALDLDRPYRELSHGNKQKILLLQAFMHAPRLLILDEPTLGLDPLLQQEFRVLLDETVARGATVFLSSHVLSEVEQVCHRIAFITAGRIARAGSLAELRALRIHRVEVALGRPVERSVLARVPGVSDIALEDGHVRCSVQGSIAPLLTSLEPNDIQELDSRELTLEELFLAEYGNAPRA